MGKMRFEEFTSAVVEKIREYLPIGFATASVDLQTVTKNNDVKLTGLVIRSGESYIAPAIYLEHFFQNYKNGEDMGNVLADIADIRLRNEVKDTFDTEQITSFDRVRDHIVPHLVGEKWNRELLEKKPHMTMDDLAVTYHVILERDFDGVASVPVTNELMAAWGVRIAELHELALQNMTFLTPSTFHSMRSVLGSMLAVDLPDGMDEEAEQIMSEMMSQEEGMFVLSNKQKLHGASAILDKEIMRRVTELIGNDFFVIPSSVHELLIVPIKAGIEASAITDMVKDVNATQVSPDERLSDHVYRYDPVHGLYSE